MSSRIQIIVGGQYGSEAKGAVAGYLAAELDRPMCIRVAGPNAGHSVVHPETGKKYALRQIPVGAVTNFSALLGIAAGSEIDIDVLRGEIEMLEADGIKITSRLLIDPAATILEPEHRRAEEDADLTARVGSTSKGIGAARAARIMRTAGVARYSTELGNCGILESVAEEARYTLNRFGVVQIEGTQGYGLGLHTRNYPQVTSSDCTAVDFLAMVGLSPWIMTQPPEVWVVYRPYPIRVAGNSGPLYGETTWEKLGLEPEYTTVTKKMRRVGQWDPRLAEAALRANGGPAHNVHLALTMADQIDPEVKGYTRKEDLYASRAVVRFMSDMEADLDRPPTIVTTSDRTWVDLRRH